MPDNLMLTEETRTERMDSLLSGARKLGIDLTSEQEIQFQRYYNELVEGNKRANLTSVTDWEVVQARHFLDSLTASLAIPSDWLDSAALLDVGTGAGFPGLPLKIAFPGIKLTLLDATAKKTAFLSQVVEELALSSVDVLTGRAETLAHDVELREKFDVVAARALSSMSVLAEVTLPFCRIGGLVIAQKGRGIDDEVRSAAKAIDTLGGKLKAIKELDGKQTGYAGNLVVLEKVGPSPGKYPRRPGMPAKRPLRG